MGRQPGCLGEEKKLKGGSKHSAARADGVLSHQALEHFGRGINPSQRHAPGAGVGREATVAIHHMHKIVGIATTPHCTIGGEAPH
jgi:hypothetical protein